MSVVSSVFRIPPINTDYRSNTADTSRVRVYQCQGVLEVTLVHFYTPTPNASNI